VAGRCCGRSRAAGRARRLRGGARCRSGPRRCGGRLVQGMGPWPSNSAGRSSRPRRVDSATVTRTAGFIRCRLGSPPEVWPVRTFRPSCTSASARRCSTQRRSSGATRSARALMAVMSAAAPLAGQQRRRVGPSRPPVNPRSCSAKVAGRDASSAGLGKPVGGGPVRQPQRTGDLFHHPVLSETCADRSAVSAITASSRDCWACSQAQLFLERPQRIHPAFGREPRRIDRRERLERHRAGRLHHGPGRDVVRSEVSVQRRRDVARLFRPVVFIAHAYAISVDDRQDASGLPLFHKGIQGK
jgi:hypothetical protein